MAGKKQKANGQVQSAQSDQSGANASPVLETVHKRIRNTKKRLRGIEEIQAKRDAGQSLNPDQEAALASKPALVAILDELDKLTKLLVEPLSQETAAAAAQAKEQALKSLPPPPAQPTKSDEEWIKEREEAVEAAKAEAKAEALKTATTIAPSPTSAKQSQTDTVLKQGIATLIELIYYAHVFDPYMPFPHPAQFERHACLTYAAHSKVNVTLEDLDALALFGKLLTSKPFGAAISHAEALERCKDLAVRYIISPTSPLPGTGTTGDQLKSKLEEVLKSDFCVVVPRGLPPAMQGMMPPMMGAQGVAAAAASGRLHAPHGAVGKTNNTGHHQQQHHHHQQQQHYSHTQRQQHQQPNAAAHAGTGTNDTKKQQPQQQHNQQPQQQQLKEKQVVSVPDAPHPSTVPAPAALATVGGAAPTTTAAGTNLVDTLFGAGAAKGASKKKPHTKGPTQSQSQGTGSDSVGFGSDSNPGLAVSTPQQQQPQQQQLPTSTITAVTTTTTGARVLDAPRPPRPQFNNPPLQQQQQSGDGGKNQSGRGNRSNNNNNNNNNNNPSGNRQRTATKGDATGGQQQQQQQQRHQRQQGGRTGQRSGRGDGGKDQKGPKNQSQASQKASASAATAQ